MKTASSRPSPTSPLNLTWSKVAGSGASTSACSLVPYYWANAAELESVAETAPVLEPEPVAEPEPVVEAEPVAEEPPAEEAPAAREGSGNIDQAEMRRRIEETRARLKAKAFDAMMSGEAALLSRDSGEKPVPSADDVKIDEETGSAIDESLSQEEY